MSHYNTLILALQARLGSIFRYIELDLGQLENYDTRPAVAFPCALLRFRGQYEQRQLGTQINRFTLECKLGFDVYGNTSNLLPIEAREKALQYLYAEQELYTLLQGWTANGLLCEPFVRVSDADMYGQEGLRKRLITFKAAYADDPPIIATP